jgi:Protein of unknown function (DUF3102)
LGEIEKSRLHEPAGKINSEHSKFLDAYRATWQHALRVGSLLVEAKAEVGHGNWGAWVEENCAFSDRTARDYMRIARHRERVEELLKSAGSADLSIQGVLRELAAPVSNIPTRERVILKRASEMVDAGHHLSSLTPNMEALEQDPDEVRRGFVAETAWKAMMCSAYDYRLARLPLSEALEYGDPITPELLVEVTPQMQEAADATRWWVEQSEWIEAQVRACDWPPGQGMPNAALDEERKHMLLPELYVDDDEYVRWWNDDEGESEYPGDEDGYGLPSPRASVNARCGTPLV